MSIAIRAIYENGLLRPLVPIQVSEGEVITIFIENNDNLTREDVALRLREAGLLVEYDEEEDDFFEPSDAELARVGQLLASAPKTSLEYIREDRDERF